MALDRPSRAGAPRLTTPITPVAHSDTVGPVDDGPQPILASDTERDRAIVGLRDAVGEGRLTLEEFSERVGAAQLARTDQDLARLSRDLPEPAAPSSPAVAAEAHRAICSHLTRRGPWSLPERPPLPGGPRLVIECSGPGGTLYVRSEPSRTATLRALLTGE